jgi:hypothetical protein
MPTLPLRARLGAALAALLLIGGCSPDLTDEAPEEGSTTAPTASTTPGATTPCTGTASVLSCGALVEDSQLTGGTDCGESVDLACSREAEALGLLHTLVGPRLPQLGSIWITEMGGDIGGYASPAFDEGARWELVVIGDGGERDHILMHEYGHISTMHDLIGAANPSTCDVPLLYGDCPAPGTLARAFIDSFWSGEVGEILADVRTRYPELDPQGEQELRERLGADGLACQFVTEDARVDPAEDLAETYASLVLGTAGPTCGTDKLAWLVEALGDSAPLSATEG